MARNEGRPAFPVAGSVEFNSGMTMRQWYKGMAISGLMANGIYAVTSNEGIVKIAASIADALTAEDHE